ncbi:hypothetical protein Hanom_Chr12g01111881 [Helianthus anomalus]
MAIATPAIDNYDQAIVKNHSKNSQKKIRNICKNECIPEAAVPAKTACIYLSGISPADPITPP